MNLYDKLKVGNRVEDSWYGIGVVLAITKNRIIIKLKSQEEPWPYDRAHVNKFIRKIK